MSSKSWNWWVSSAGLCCHWRRAANSPTRFDFAQKSVENPELVGNFLAAGVSKGKRIGFFGQIQLL